LCNIIEIANIISHKTVKQASAVCAIFIFISTP